MYALSFPERPIPNFHAERMPNFSISTTEFLSEHVQVIHYGYFNSTITDQKRDFYLKNSAVSNVAWGEDMRASKEEYIQKWGMGYLTRRGV